jgi:hypothetical protein
LAKTSEAPAVAIGLDMQKKALQAEPDAVSPS